jgi:hypothetical protein
VHAVGLPFVCGQCGLRWNDGDDGFRRIAGGEGVRLTSSTVRTNCPHYGGIASLVDGDYEVRGGRWQLVRQLTGDLRSAEASAQDFARLAALLRQAGEAGQAADEVASAIEAQTPFTKVAEAFRAHPPGWTAWLIAVLLAIVL